MPASKVMHGNEKNRPGPNQGRPLNTGCPDCRVLSSTLFRSLSEEQVKNFSCIFCPTHYHRNQILFFEGGAAQHLFALNVGLVKMVKSLENGKERITRLLFPGDLFGLEALNQESYPLTAVVLEESEICSIPRDQFFAFLRSNPDISLDMIRLLVSEIAEVRSQMTNMSFKDARMRVATFLLSLLSMNEESDANSCSLTLPLTSQEIAEILELSPETVSRTWQLFRQEGLIQKRGRHLDLKDLQALEATARR